MVRTRWKEPSTPEKETFEPGEELIQCKRGFTWNNVISSIPAHVPDKVVVLKEYENFILVEAHFEKNGGKSYKEAINKGSYLSGDTQFKRLGKAYF